MSLMNLLISISVSMLLMHCALQWWQIIKKTELGFQKKITELNTSRTILQFMHLDFENAGYLGYRTHDEGFPINQIAQEENPIQLPSDRRVVYGFKTTPGLCQLQGFSRQICERVKANSDFLVIYNVAQNITPLKQRMTSPLEALRTKEKSGIRAGSLVLIADLLQGDLFIANDVRNEWLFHQTTGGKNRTEALSKAYGEKAEVVELQTLCYYLGIPSRAQNAQISRKSVLFREDLRHGPEEIAENVEKFEVEYGIFTRENGVQYRKAQEISMEDWIFVVSVRLKITLSDLPDPLKETYYEFSIRKRRNFNFNASLYVNDFSSLHPFFATNTLRS